LLNGYPDIVIELRGAGLLVGLKFSVNNRAFYEEVRKSGLHLAGGGDNIVRLLPPRNISEEIATDLLLDLLR
jgi:acetylornithine/N-succinyldiaminopimelate aminotransferase